MTTSNKNNSIKMLVALMSNYMLKLSSLKQLFLEIILHSVNLGTDPPSKPQPSKLFWTSR